MKLKSAIAKAEKQYGLHEIDPNSREILQTIAAANVLDTKIRASDIRNANVFGTLPTVLTRLQKLVDEGWIDRKQDAEDGRVVLLEITAKCRTKFKKISLALKTY